MRVTGQSPTGTKGRAPGQEVRGQNLPEAESILAFRRTNEVQFFSIFHCPVLCFLKEYCCISVI